jgi:hypothetical protein
MTSEIDLLKQENARLMTENAEFKAKYDEAKNEITKLRAELRNRIEELEKARIDTAVENTRRDVPTYSFWQRNTPFLVVIGRYHSYYKTYPNNIRQCHNVYKL